MKSQRSWRYLSFKSKGIEVVSGWCRSTDVIFFSPFNGRVGHREDQENSSDNYMAERLVLPQEFWLIYYYYYYYYSGAVYLAPGGFRWIHLVQTGKRILAQELCGLTDRALN